MKRNMTMGELLLRIGDIRDSRAGEPSVHQWRTSTAAELWNDSNQATPMQYHTSSLPFYKDFSVLYSPMIYGSICGLLYLSLFPSYQPLCVVIGCIIAGVFVSIKRSKQVWIVKALFAFLFLMFFCFWWKEVSSKVL